MHEQGGLYQSRHRVSDLHSISLDVFGPLRRHETIQSLVSSYAHHTSLRQRLAPWRLQIALPMEVNRRAVFHYRTFFRRIERRFLDEDFSLDSSFSSRSSPISMHEPGVQGFVPGTRL